MAEQALLLAANLAFAAVRVSLLCSSESKELLSPTAEEAQTHGSSETGLSSNRRPDVLKQEICKMVNVTQSHQPS